MLFDTLIKNGIVATAVDTFPADIAISNGKVVAIGQALPAESAKQSFRREGQLCLPRRY